MAQRKVHTRFDSQEYNYSSYLDSVSYMHLYMGLEAWPGKSPAAEEFRKALEDAYNSMQAFVEAEKNKRTINRTRIKVRLSPVKKIRRQLKHSSALKIQRAAVHLLDDG